MKKLIVLDPGHGGNDGGAPGTLAGAPSRNEKDDNLKMSKAVKELLKQQGHTVLLTRDGDTNPSYDDRIGLANIKAADLFLSIHRNSFNTTTAKGIEIWARYQPHQAAMATILEELAKEPNQGNRGAKMGAYLVLYNAKMPAGLVEIGFISNYRDNELYDANFNTYAEAIARGICYALGEEYKTVKTAPETPPNSLYRVQVGAFAVKANAEAFLTKVQGMGLPAFLVDADKVDVEG